MTADDTPTASDHTASDHTASDHTASDHTAAVAAWFAGRLPAEWTAAAAPEVVVDRVEITVTLTVAAPDLDADADEAQRREAEAGRIAGFRDDTKQRRIAIAREAEHRFERKVAWAVTVGETTQLFTHLAVPAMTRLRQPERLVLDTLIAAGVARSVRSAPRGASSWSASTPTTG